MGDAVASEDDLALTIDDVLEAHALGLFSGASGARVTEWRLIARCSAHGQVWNIVTIPEYQAHPSAAAYVRCPPCLELGIDRRLPPSLVLKLTLREHA